MMKSRAFTYQNVFGTVRYVSLGDVKARNLKGMYPILVPNGKNLLILSFLSLLRIG